MRRNSSEEQLSAKLQEWEERKDKEDTSHCRCSYQSHKLG